jgi:NADP-dependent 3-hydroxy acid dehydrogenase YdfG
LLRSLVVIAIAANRVPATATAGEGDCRRAVLKTGATSGIGRAAAEGYLVYAGSRKAEDIEELSQIDGI